MDASFVILPPEVTARQMVGRYFEDVASTIHFVHIPSLNTWLNEMLEEYKGAQARPVEPSKRAVIFMLLAAVQSHNNSQSREGNADLR
jgi:galactonate dehydratase